MTAACSSPGWCWLLQDQGGDPVPWMTLERSWWASALRSSSLLIPYSQAECRWFLGKPQFGAHFFQMFLCMIVRSSSAAMSSEGKFGKFLTSTACSFPSMSLLTLLNVLQRLSQWLHNSCISSYLILSNTLAEAWAEAKPVPLQWWFCLCEELNCHIMLHSGRQQELNDMIHMAQKVILCN